MDLIEELKEKVSAMDTEEKVDYINQVKIALHEISPFKNEPVDCVIWVKNKNVHANDYNPNAVAPPEMELLKLSIDSDGYTQPIVTMPSKDGFEIIDGFHRNRVGKEYSDITEKVHGYLPTVQIRAEKQDKNSRIASTIRHNRARGKHKIDAMSEIVLELKNRNWKNSRIAKELGMDEDEILRLCQITGLSELFLDDDFSKSWDVENSEQDSYEEDQFIEIDDESLGLNEEKVRTVNTSDEQRIFHTWDKWECQKAGFFKTTVDGMNKEEAENKYAEFLNDTDLFSITLNKVINEWKYSCEQNLTNNSLNRIAWLGQASVCYHLGIPSDFRTGYFLLSEEEQLKANNTALKYLNKWLVKNGRQEVDLEQATTNRQSTLY